MNLNPYVKCVCPSCFEEIYLGECAIVSSSTTRNPADRVLKKASKGLFARMHVEPLDGPKFTSALACRECTACGYLLPYNIELVPSFMLVVVGKTFSGKSHYIAALIQQLRTEWISRAKGIATMTCLTREVEDVYRTEYLRIFRGEQAIAQTRPAVIKPNTKSRANPLIYTLVTSRSPKHLPTSLNLMIYDAAGEDFESQDRIVNVAQFVLRTSALIFVADPYSMPDITSKLMPHLPPNQQTPELQKAFSIAQLRRPVENFNDTIGVFERYKGHPQGSRLPNTPIAVMLSKADLFHQYPGVDMLQCLDHLQRPNGYTFITEPQYGGDLNLDDIDKVDEEVKTLLRSYQQGDLVAATHRLKQVKFFATSATGGLPDPDPLKYNFAKAKPCRCLDPLLWILYKHGVIKGVWSY